MSPTILITGASTGIGRATAELFANRGWDVAATMRDPSNAGDLGERSNCIVPALDVTDLDAVDSAIAATLDRFGRIDAVVNNAGFAVMGPLEAIPAADIEKQLAVNVVGPVAVIRAVLPHFRAQGQGTIVNVSSIVGRTAFPLGAIYAASKFALEGLSEGLRFELDEIGVRVKLVEPGLVATDFASRSMTFHSSEAAPYRAILTAMSKAAKDMADAAEPPAAVAETIWRAVTGNEEQLRYVAGATARDALNAWRAVDDETYYRQTRARFGLIGSTV